MWSDDDWSFGLFGHKDVHMIVNTKGGSKDIKTGSPPRMKGEAVARWMSVRQDVGIERSFAGVWHRDGDIPH